jgi:NTP pyrophosphatase (non-canonical NTP hydrolase)
MYGALRVLQLRAPLRILQLFSSRMKLLDVQESVHAFSTEYRLNCSPQVRVLDLVSEVGELAKEVLKGSSYGSVPFTPGEAWSEEIGDVVFSLIALANSTGVDLGDALTLAMAKYASRIEEYGDAGSGGRHKVS